MHFASRPAIAALVFSLPVFAGSAPGIRNFDQVDAHVYRGGQPTDEGLRFLAKLGVKTVLDLRGSGDRSKAEERAATAAGMRYVNVPMTGIAPPTDAEITGILAMLEDGTTGPVFVHCLRGADRTGTVIAAYHISHDKWDNARALKDAKAHGMSFFHLPRRNYIKRLRPLTVDANAASPCDASVEPAVAATPVTAGVKN